jgi:starch synthase
MVTSKMRRAALELPRSNPPQSIRAVHLSVEYWPWARTGGLAEAVQGLAESLHADGVPTAVILPLYRGIQHAGVDLEAIGDPFRVRLGAREEPGRLFCLRDPGAGPPVYFIDHPEYFDRAEIYGEPGSDYPDNARRFGFFTAAALHVLPDLAPDAQVIHVHDWHTALAPMLVRTRLAGNPYYDRLASVLTVHNAGFQGTFPLETLADLGLAESLGDDRWLGWYGRVNWLKGGLVFADRVTTVSPTHAQELRTPAGGFGLHEIFAALGHRFVGIMNGIDPERWDPTADPAISAWYSASVLEGKRRCKADLQAASGLAADPATPLIGMSARMVSQKGLPLVVESLATLSQDAQFVFLGRGEAHFERALHERAAAAPDRIAFDEGFTDAHPDAGAALRGDSHRAAGRRPGRHDRGRRHRVPL